MTLHRLVTHGKLNERCESVCVTWMFLANPALWHAVVAATLTFIAVALAASTSQRALSSTRLSQVQSPLGSQPFPANLILE